MWLDVETQWNSNYLMLELAVKYQNAFNLLAFQDSKYRDELTREKMKGVSLNDDWEHVAAVSHLFEELFMMQ